VEVDTGTCDEKKMPESGAVEVGVEDAETSEEKKVPRSTAVEVTVEVTEGMLRTDEAEAVGAEP
jgi:hypothetical protein